MNNKELDKIVDQFSIHKPRGYAKGTIARKEMKNKLNKKLQSLLKQAELRGEVKGIDKAQLIVESTWGTTDMMTKIRECKSDLSSELTKLEGDNNE